MRGRWCYTYKAELRYYGEYPYGVGRCGFHPSILNRSTEIWEVTLVVEMRLEYLFPGTVLFPGADSWFAATLPILRELQLFL